MSTEENRSYPFRVDSGLKWLTAFGVIALDQGTKWVAEKQGGVILNQGGVGGFLPGQWWLVGVGMVLLVMWWWWMKQGGVWGIIGSMMWSAGMANYLDRWIYGGVRDFIFYPYLEIYGNMADIILVLGMAWGLIEWRHETLRAKNHLSGSGSDRY